MGRTGCLFAKQISLRTVLPLVALSDRRIAATYYLYSQVHGSFRATSFFFFVRRFDRSTTRLQAGGSRMLLRPATTC